MFVPPSSGSYGAAGTSSRDDVPKKPRSVVGQLFGSSASVPVVIGIGVLCMVVGAAVGVLLVPDGVSRCDPFDVELRRAGGGQSVAVDIR